MSLFSSKMQLLTAVTLEKHADSVTKELLEQGVLDFVGTNVFSPEDSLFLKAYHGSLSRSGAAEARRRIESLYQQAGLTPPAKALKVSSLTPFDLGDYEDRLEKLNNKLMVMRDEQKNLNQELLKLQEIHRYLASEARRSGGEDFITIRTGFPGRGGEEELKRSLRTASHFCAPAPEEAGTGKAAMVLVYLNREQPAVEQILSKYQWEEALPVLSRSQETEYVIRRMDQAMSDIKQRQQEIQKSIKERIAGDREELDRMWGNLKISEFYGRIQESFSHTGRTVVFSGWLPSEAVEKLEGGIRRVTGGQCLVEWSLPEEYPREKIPVELKDSKLLDPFQMLVRNYAVPEYGMINPVPFVAIAYFCMFGLMFADAGQGAVIVLTGLLGWLRSRRRGTGPVNLFKLFIYCGLGAILGGVLFGSYFGRSLFPALWFDYHGVVTGHAAGGPVESVYGILKITVFFGIGVIGLGLVLNWINLFRKRTWLPLLLDKSGILGGWFYGCGIYTAFYFVRTGYRELPSPDFIAPAFGIPLGLILIKIFLEAGLFSPSRPGKKPAPSHQFRIVKIPEYLMEWLVEALELFSGYLANTLSFMRVAGLGIAHVSLMSAFFSIAQMTGGGAAALIIEILGNALVIALEGLSAGIQALRLNYYEFFSRYFTGKGIAYNPVSLRNP
ncbi:MAG: ATPase [Spirochaetales bacterium]|jgi:V/A-type H+-transporting ATPase subunit I|nr:ATPase [Spirochaetales bacterium]